MISRIKLILFNYPLTLITIDVLSESLSLLFCIIICILFVLKYEQNIIFFYVYIL